MHTLKSWLSAEYGRNVRLARHLGIKPSFVAKLRSGEKAIPVDRAAAIEAFTGGEVTRQDMFPNTWHRIWPELANATAPAADGVTHG